VRRKGFARKLGWVCCGTLEVGWCSTDEYSIGDRGRDTTRRGTHRVAEGGCPLPGSHRT